MKTIQLLILLLSMNWAFAQEDDGLQIGGNRVEPYWVSNFDPQSGNTVVSFFDENQHLKYREEFKSRILKPNKHNVRYLDQMLQLVMNGALLKSNINTIELPSRLPTSKVPLVISSEPMLLKNPLTTRFSILPRITVNDDGNLFVYIYNPGRIGIRVHFHDNSGNALHHDKTAGLYYGKILNVSELGPGVYELTLNSGQISAQYSVKVGSEKREVNVKQVAVASNSTQ